MLPKMGMVPVEFWWELGSGSPIPRQLDPGEVESSLAGTSAVHLGSGAFGETWAIDLDGERRAAKILHEPNYPIALLNREIEALQRGHSEYVVELIDVVSRDFRGELRHVLIFEFIDGGSAAAPLQIGEWPSEGEIVRFAYGLFSAAWELHSHDAIHRDIKLENLALRQGKWSSPVLLDLGLAKMLDQSSLTVYPTMIGTLPFMSPEQVRGARAKHASDVWACGIVLYILAAKRHPFYRDHAHRVDHGTALSLLEQGPQPLPTTLNPELADLIERLLSFKPHKRGSARTATRKIEALT